jgi:opacity protein-like surface antigen
MKHSSLWLRVPAVGALAAATLLLGAGAARAQDDHARGDRGRDVQLGLGVGLVDPQDSGTAEVYSSASLRIRVGHGKGSDAGAGQWDGDHYRGRPPNDRSGGILGYVEPEVGYWKGGDKGQDFEDLLAGINLIGVVPTRSADYYLGVGFGVHFFKAELDATDFAPAVKEDDQRFGGNLQVGVDVNLGPNVALFGTGRLDLLEGEIAERQTKVYAGIRLKY